MMGSFMTSFVRNLTLGSLILVAVALNGTGCLEAINGGVWEATEVRAYGWPWVACSLSSTTVRGYTGEEEYTARAPIDSAFLMWTTTGTSRSTLFIVPLLGNVTLWISIAFLWWRVSRYIVASR